MSPWVEKYRPQNFSDVKGQNQAVAQIKKFLEDYNIGKLTSKRKKALLLYGPPGVGKTTLAYVAANSINAEIFELNASDFRSKSKLMETLKPAIEQQSLTNKNKLILVDEADGISGFADRGGIAELNRLIQTTSFPIIITANDAWSKKLSTVRRKCEMIKLKEIDYNTIKQLIFDILKKENMFVKNEIVTSIAIKSKGDIRAALNDIQTISKIKDPEELEDMTFDERNKETDIFNALKLVFKGKPNKKTLRVFDSVNMPLDKIILWVEENIPKEYSGKELVRAYELLSKVDLFKGRIYKKQYWRFLVYENAFLSYGISSAKTQLKTGFTSYKKPSRILKIWLNNQRTAKKKSIAKKYAELCHIGYRRAMREFPILKPIIKSDVKIQDQLKLDEDELAYLNK